jgi:hypothetical protein
MKFLVNVSYSQLAVFDAGLNQPFNNWADEHFSQGFAWRPGSVSFMCLVENGSHNVEISMVDFFDDINLNAVRVFDVPFEGPSSGFIEIGSITETNKFNFPLGSYVLICELIEYQKNSDKFVKLIFAKKEIQHFKIVLADFELPHNFEIVKDATPA